MTNAQEVYDRFHESKDGLIKEGVVFIHSFENAELKELFIKAAKLSGGNSFYSKYHYMMRLIDLFLAMEGYCLRVHSPHYAAGRVLLRLFPERGVDASRLGEARNALKYHRRQPDNSRSVTLDFVINHLENFVDHANRLQANE